MHLPTGDLVSILLLVLIGVAFPQQAAADEASPASLPGAAADPVDLQHAADVGAAHEDGALHFSHPLIAESPSPDTKLRIDYDYRRETGEEKAYRHTLRLEGEYAFRPWLSVEIDVPYTFRDPDDGPSRRNFDTVEVALKLASFVLEERGLLLGGGLELGLPTGDDSKGIGSDETLEVEPFLDFGYRYRQLETVGFLEFGIPTNTSGGEEPDLELGWNVAFLYHVTPRIEGLLEFDSEHVFGGEEDGNTVVNITPGLKVAPFASRNFEIGAGASLPITSDEEFDVRATFSIFYHF